MFHVARSGAKIKDLVSVACASAHHSASCFLDFLDITIAGKPSAPAPPAAAKPDGHRRGEGQRRPKSDVRAGEFAAEQPPDDNGQRHPRQAQQADKNLVRIRARI